PQHGADVAGDRPGRRRPAHAGVRGSRRRAHGRFRLMATGALASLSYVIIDASDTEAEAAFWGTVLGVELADRFGDGYVILAPSHEGAPRLTFQPVPEAKIVKNRLHLDLRVPDIETATVEFEKLGAS